METGLPTGSMKKYNTLVKLTLSFVTIHYNAGHTYTMQELVKEVTLITMDLQFCMELITQYGSTVYIGIAMGCPAL